MPYFPLTKNKFINTFEIDFLLNDLEFNEDEIQLVNDIWITEFNGKNINAIKDDNGTNIAMNLVLQLTDAMLNKNILITIMWLDKETLQSAYSYILAKVILNDDFDLNASSYSNSTLLSNIIWTNSIDVLKFLLKHRKDINVKYYSSKFWDTYIDLANELWNFDVAEILEKHINNNLIDNQNNVSNNINNVFDEYEQIENLIIDYNEDFLLSSNVKNKLDLAIEYKRNSEYMKAFEVYYTHLIPKYPNHPTIMYSFAKLVLTIWHLQLAFNIFNRVISIQSALWREEYIWDSKIFIEDLILARDNYDKKISLQSQVSWQFDFEPLSKEEWDEIFWLNYDFNNEYEYLNFLFNN